ncbi:MAG: pyrroline-5-carboxylate reductase [Spirochaetales bacterium]|nr:pyrroline-5-carboxylate reductase [Spirochaetales bacterium]
MSKICFIGAGNMAFAMASALYEKKKDITIGLYDINPERVNLFKDSFNNSQIYNSIEELCIDSDFIVLAVKPQVIESVFVSLNSFKGIAVSIIAGKSIEFLKSGLPNAKIVRVMPNTPSLVGAMAAGVSFDKGFNQVEIVRVMDFLQCSGEAIEVSESQMDAVTGISGSGPAFVARIIQKFINAGISQGLTPETSRKLAVNTFLGTAKLILEKDMDIDNLINMVSSPGGTTIAGRGVLENSNIDEIINNTVEATVKKSRELGQKC